MNTRIATGTLLIANITVSYLSDSLMQWFAYVGASWRNMYLEGIFFKRQVNTNIKPHWKTRDPYGEKKLLDMTPTRLVKVHYIYPPKTMIFI